MKNSNIRDVLSAIDGPFLGGISRIERKGRRKQGRGRAQGEGRDIGSPNLVFVTDLYTTSL
jgi:hypothetical protein